MDGFSSRQGVVIAIPEFSPIFFFFKTALPSPIIPLSPVHFISPESRHQSSTLPCLVFSQFSVSLAHAADPVLLLSRSSRCRVARLTPPPPSVFYPALLSSSLSSLSFSLAAPLFFFSFLLVVRPCRTPHTTTTIPPIFYSALSPSSLSSPCRSRHPCSYSLSLASHLIQLTLHLR